MTNHSRLDAAIEIIKEGQAFKIGSLLIGMHDTKSLFVTGWTQYNYLNSLTKAIALEELTSLKQDFQKIILSSSDWTDFIKEKNIEYNLAYNDSGKAGIGICSERSEQVIWLTNLSD